MSQQHTKGLDWELVQVIPLIAVRWAIGWVGNAWNVRELYLGDGYTFNVVHLSTGATCWEYRHLDL